MEDANKVPLNAPKPSDPKAQAHQRAKERRNAKARERRYERRHQKWVSDIMALSHAALVEEVRKWPWQDYSSNLFFVFHDDSKSMKKFFEQAFPSSYGRTLWQEVHLTEEIAKWLWDNDVVYRVRDRVAVAEWPEDRGDYRSVNAAIIEFKKEADLTWFKIRWG